MKNRLDGQVVADVQDTTRERYTLGLEFSFALCDGLANFVEMDSLRRAARFGEGVHVCLIQWEETAALDLIKKWSCRLS